MNRFDKDGWIKCALAQRVYVAREDGRIFKFKGVKDERRIYKPVVPQTHERTGRVYFTMTFEGITKSVLVNRMIGLALIPNPLGLPEVNHKDGVKAHNCKDNLEWSSRSEQEKHAFSTGLKSARGSSNANAKLTASDVAKIRALPEASLAELAILFSVSAKTIGDIRAGRTWSHL